MKAFADLADLPEAERIAAIVRAARARRGEIIGVAVDDEPGKADRYILQFKMAGLQVLDDRKGPVPGSWFIRVTAVID